jgi:RNA polymerase sigma-70 factor (ECF subfamily)
MVERTTITSTLPPDRAEAGVEVVVTPPGEIPKSAEDVFHSYGSRVYNLARRMLNNDLDAEDVTQDVLLQVVRKLPSFRGESAFPTWLHRVTVNAALGHRRKKASSDQHLTMESLDSILERAHRIAPVRRWSVSPDAAALDRETQQLMERAIAGLPEPYRDVFVLSDEEGIANADICEMLGLTLPAVKSRLHRARLMLRDALAPHFEEVSE